VAGVTVFFTKDEHHGASDVLRSLGISYYEARGVQVDSVEYTSDHRLARLVKGNHLIHVPTSNILLVHAQVTPEDGE
jgi:hypothetical protein